VLLLGFSIICVGVLCISTSSPTCRCGNNEPVFYCLSALGLFLFVTGICWNTCHEVLKYRDPVRTFIQDPSCRELHVNTIDRPDFYPPSYVLSSTDPEKETFPLTVASTLKHQEAINIPPPPYSESCTEFLSETNEQEPPPPYELSVRQLQQQQTADQDSDPGTESESHPSTQEKSY
ncbi:TM252 protein, partial [Pedionomus torquatus]|nr:TM252 protein [Pedionomus torquatus]